MKLKLIIFLTISLLLSLSVYPQKEEDFLKYANESNIIVVAEVIKRYPSPLFWSGVILSAQNVKYKVITTLNGKLEDNEILAGHLIFKNNYMADEKIPQLSPKLFKDGNKLILILNKEQTPCTGTMLSRKRRPIYCAEVISFSENLVEKIKAITKN
jgi:hypothetical protein